MKQIVSYNHNLMDMKVYSDNEIILVFQDEQQIGFKELLVINSIYIKCMMTNSKLLIKGSHLQKAVWDQINHSKIKIKFEVE